MTPDDMNPLTLGETPEDMIENEDGSVDIIEESTETEESEFMTNLAESLSSEDLRDISTELCELIEKDKKSREKRDKQYQEGLRRTGLGDDAPGGAEFEGASKVVHPVLAEACVDFASRAIKELFPAAGPVKPWIIGKVSPEKLERANRKTRYMNWQLTTQIKEYRAELEQILTQVPMGGSQYQKFWYDERFNRTRVEFVPIDDIFLPYSATYFYTSQRVTHRQSITKYELHERVKSGLYRDVFIPEKNSTPDQTLSGKANDKIEGREEDGYNEDGLRAILEIYTWREIENDEISGGDYAPYIITIDEDSEEVLSVYRNWKEGDATLEKLDWFVEWQFIPWRGAYAIGLPHLIGGLSAALTGALRALLDSAHINNAATMLKLKSGRIIGQNTSVNVTQVHDIEGPAGIDDIRKLAMPMPFNPPSPVLHSLMQDLYGLAKGVVATAEEKIGQVGDRTPVGTTMALIEQGSNTYSAIHSRLHESQKKALAILHRLNQDYLDDQASTFELGEQTVSREDFQGTMDVIPVSDPTIFSEAQRFAQSQAVLQMAQQDANNPKVPWDQIAVRRRILKQMRIEGVDELLPPEKEPISADSLTENTMLMQGHRLQADPEQDHYMHIQSHMLFLSSPIQLKNPLVQPQALTQLLAHIGEHIQMYQTRLIMEVAEQENMDEQAILRGMQRAQMVLTQQLGELLSQIPQLQQELQKRVPPPPMPPEVQASIQIAQMDVQRKTQLNQATLQAKQAELQASQQLEQAKIQMKAAELQVTQQMKAAEAQFEQQMSQLEFKSNDEAEKMRQQVELMKNQQDNHQKQMTELIKNKDDNETKMMLEQIKSQLSEKSQGPDLTPQLQDLNVALTAIGQNKTNEALSEVMNGLRATIETMNRPKTIIRDESGKAQGIS